MERDEAPADDHSDHYGSIKEHMDEVMDQINQSSQTEMRENRMGDRIEQAVRELVQAIWEGEEYRRYQDIRARVHEIPELEQRIHAFRKKNYDTQNFADERSLFDQVDELEREGAEFRKDPLVNEYLDAELGICRMFQRINWELVQNIDFDLGFDYEH